MPQTKPSWQCPSSWGRHSTHAAFTQYCFVASLAAQAGCQPPKPHDTQVLFSQMGFVAVVQCRLFVHSVHAPVLPQAGVAAFLATQAASLAVTLPTLAHEMHLPALLQIGLVAVVQLADVAHSAQATLPPQQTP